MTATLSCMASFGATGNDSLFITANRLYEQGLYDSAASIYSRMAELQPSAVLEYNLGNAFYKTGKIAPAILHYERALRLSPGDEDIIHNLRIANLKVSDRGEVEGKDILTASWHRFLNLLPGHRWTALTLYGVQISFVWAVVTLFLRTSRLKRFTFWGTVVFITLTVLSLLLTIASHSIGKGRREAIVFAASAYVKSEPRSGSTDLFILHEGAKVQVVEDYSGWKKIQFGSEKVGWMTNDALEEI